MPSAFSLKALSFWKSATINWCSVESHLPRQKIDFHGFTMLHSSHNMKVDISMLTLACRIAKQEWSCFAFEMTTVVLENTEGRALYLIMQHAYIVYHMYIYIYVILIYGPTVSLILMHGCTTATPNPDCMDLHGVAFPV